MSRFRVAALAATALVVLALVGSLVAGIRDGGGRVADDSEEEEAAERRLRVEVLNAAGVPGLARTATDRLRDRGFDVVYYGNARGFAPESSLVLDRVGRTEWAREVGDALEIERVATRPDSSLFLDVTVVVGRDWAGNNKQGETPVGASPDSAVPARR